MARQNRVRPTGEIVADPARGMFMGNRGCLHDAEGQLRAARWRHRNWITCLPAFAGRSRRPMSPGKYTELFFLDEAVACAAGHRPCAECRRPVWQAFQAAWGEVHGAMSAAEIDRRLHADRIEGKRQQRHDAPADSLPDGVMVLIAGAAHLVLAGQGVRWGAEGYGASGPLPDTMLTVLTPAPMVAVMRTGWLPVLHPSALANTVTACS